MICRICKKEFTANIFKRATEEEIKNLPEKDRKRIISQNDVIKRNGNDICENCQNSGISDF